MSSRSVASRAAVFKGTNARVAACIAGAFALGAVMPTFSKLLTPVVAAGVVALYLVALVVTGELGREDLALVRSIAARRAKR